MKRSFQILLLIIMAINGCLLNTATQAASPVWTLRPLSATTITVPSNGTAITQYTVSNQSNNPQTLVMNSITGVTQDMTGTNMCGSTFTLQSKNMTGSSCTLSLLINGDQLINNISSGPTICQQMNSQLCNTPSQDSLLNISIANPIAMISVTGSPLTLSTNGPAVNLTINNLSSNVTATNINADFAGTPLNNIVHQTGSNCANLAPNSSCTLSFTAGAATVVQSSFAVQGDNTNTVNPAMNVTVPGLALLAVAPQPINGDYNQNLTFTGTNLLALGSNPNAVFSGMGGMCNSTGNAPVLPLNSGFTNKKGILAGQTMYLNLTSWSSWENSCNGSNTVQLCSGDSRICTNAIPFSTG